MIVPLSAALAVFAPTRASADSTNTRAAQTSPVYFSGHVVDDATGEPIIDFALQFAGTFPQKPEELVWMPSYHGPVSGDITGKFWGEQYEFGKAWARILAPGYLPQPVTPEPVVAPARRENLVVRMKRGGELRGVVLDHAGKPVAGARVYVAGTQRLDLVDGEPGGMHGVSRSGWTFKGGSATTDADGRFAVPGGDGTGEKLVVAASDGQMISVAPLSGAGRELKLTLPQPGVIIVRYDIADDSPEAELHLRLVAGQLDAPAWKDFSSTLKPTVANQGQITLTNLAPGTYDFARTKTLETGDGGRGVSYERRTVVLAAGQTQRVDVVRSAGFSIHGGVTGLADTDALGAYIYVRGGEATGDVRSQWSVPLFDALTCDRDGQFKTARLEPGTYTVMVEAYEPEPPSRVMTTGIRLPNYAGTAKVTVAADAAPVPLKIELRRRP